MTEKVLVGDWIGPWPPSPAWFLAGFAETCTRCGRPIKSGDVIRLDDVHAASDYDWTHWDGTVAYACCM